MYVYNIVLPKIVDFRNLSKMWPKWSLFNDQHCYQFNLHFRSALISMGMLQSHLEAFPTNCIVTQYYQTMTFEINILPDNFWVLTHDQEDQEEHLDAEVTVGWSPGVLDLLAHVAMAHMQAAVDRVLYPGEILVICTRKIKNNNKTLTVFFISYGTFDVPFWKIKINIKLHFPVITWKKI